MSNRRYINAVMSVKRIAPAPATIKDGTAAMRATSDRAADASRMAGRLCIDALVQAVETGGDNNQNVAVGYTFAANAALDAADAYCAVANDLAALATLYRTGGN